MVAVAASPTPGASSGSPFPTKLHDHPPYKDMILTALEALKGRKGSSRQAISKYIVQNYNDLPPTHSSLLTHQLRRLHSKGEIRFFKNLYKISPPPVAGISGADSGTKKRGRPRKNFQPDFNGAPKKRGRPRKVGNDSVPAKKMKFGSPAVVDPAAVYILPQAEQLKSGFLQSLPGAVAIVLPEGLLSKKTAKSPVLILPNGVQSLVNSSAGKNVGKTKKIEVKKKNEQTKMADKIRVGLSRRKAVPPKQLLVHNRYSNVDYGNSGVKKLGRPRKIRDFTLPENGHLKSVDETEQGELKIGGISKTLPESFEALQNSTVLELKKRSVGRPRKNLIDEGPNTLLATGKAA